MQAFHFMSAAAQTAFANLLGPALDADLNRTVASLPGGFSRKQVKGRDYWYYQYKTDGTLTQVYVGPDSEEVRALVQRHGSEQAASSASHLKALTKAALALGCVAMPPLHAKVLKRLADHRFFRAGGLLIGTHTFLAYQNMLGAKWGAGTNTMDRDFAHPGKNMVIALPVGLQIDTHKAIESLEMGFLPNLANTTYTKADERDFELDFVTVQGREGDVSQRVDALNISLQPLKFMEYSMEDVYQTAVLTQDGPVVVNVPAPERFALHKLIEAGERSGKQVTKSLKDIDQANCLIEYLAQNRPGSLQDAYADLRARGAGWTKRFDAGLKVLRHKHPDTSFSTVVSPEAAGKGAGTHAKAPSRRPCP
jgi:hypothetical protein